MTAGDPYAHRLGCWADFEVLASEPLVAGIPGAYSVKTVVDRSDGDALYFQDSQAYALHWEFASAHLSGGGLPLVPDLGTFNATEYYSPERRFLLGAVTWYEEPAAWTYAVSPYDAATADMIAQAFYRVRDSAYFGGELAFHPTSSALEITALGLPDDVPVITTDELFAGITYQPLNPGVAMGQLAFYDAASLEAAIPDFREIVVLDAVPGDISIVAGIITDHFQTPLSHINVLSQNRGTPNMALTGASEDDALRALEGAWVELSVEASSWSIGEVSQAEADAWWEGHRPAPLDVPPMDLSVTDLRDAEGLLDLERLPLADALAEAVPAFGGKAANFGGLTHIPDVMRAPDAFVAPVYYYEQHLRQGGLWAPVDAFLADAALRADPEGRREALEGLREAIEDAPLDDDFLDALLTKLRAEHYGERIRFRSSTTAEDLQGFNGAGLYDSESADPEDPDDPVSDAVRTVWASLWSERAFEEREYYGIDHRGVGMALLIHPSFPDEEANGVAITANIFDTSGMEPGFYVNAQEGEASVVEPEPGVTSDQLLYYFYSQGQPTVFLSHSSLVPDGEAVLTAAETYDLGVALDAIHSFFLSAYGAPMDVEFKFDDDARGRSVLWVKQARPYPGWGSR